MRHDQEPAQGDRAAEFVISNEFATVAIRLNEGANSPRLEITDLTTGCSVCLDAMELASLTTATHGDFDHLMSRLAGSLL